MSRLADPPKEGAVNDRLGEPSSRLLGVDGGVDLYWLPLGAGGRSVRLNGRVFEWLSARRAHRSPLEIYHAALEVHVAEGRYVIEMTPEGNGAGERHDVVVGGAVGSRHAGRLRLFRYELRCWRNGTIPDIAEAVASPVHVSVDPQLARRLLDLAPFVPCAVWGRDEFAVGEMWTSNSVASWLLVCAGVDIERVLPPVGGRAPGWDAGVAVARLPALTERGDVAVQRLGRSLVAYFSAGSDVHDPDGLATGGEHTHGMRSDNTALPESPTETQR